MSILQLIITGGFVIVGILVSFAPIVKVAREKANQLSTSDELRTLQRNKEKLEAESSEGEKTKYDELYDAISSYNELIYENGQDTFTGELPLPQSENLQLYLEDEELKTIAQITIQGHYFTRIRSKEKEKKEGETAEMIKTLKTITKQEKERFFTLANCFIPVKNTSMPVGGENTLSVLYGRPRKGLGLDNKFNISKGDVITLETIWDTISYEIDDLVLISADDIESLKIVPGKDIIVLMIAEPQNKTRHCIFASRIEGNDDSDD